MHLTKLIDDLVITHNRRERTLAIFLDFEKAFDKVWHQTLLAKMLNIDAPIQLVNIIKSFLEDRTYQVRVEDALSSLHPIKAGVPQISCYYYLVIYIVSDILETSHYNRNSKTW